MKQQTNNSQSTTAQALTSFPENPQLYIFAYTITGILCISWTSLQVGTFLLSCQVYWLSTQSHH